MSDARITELEVRFMHQQALLDDLSAVLHEQQLVIARLEARVKDLERRVADGSEAIPPAEKPPHY